MLIFTCLFVCLSWGSAQEARHGRRAEATEGWAAMGLGHWAGGCLRCVDDQVKVTLTLDREVKNGDESPIRVPLRQTTGAPYGQPIRAGVLRLTMGCQAALGAQQHSKDVRYRPRRLKLTDRALANRSDHW